ncbi:cold shock domain-containing protein [Coralloluteibacterium stylophorae]|uniref:Cold shock domain-containing protein n=1 Tax=Coralloluteibacterium stylophorae TaxID=1776034 RepID=A0A8J7VQX8_9GAMM|nr:cold shock domain-containing protein [Coralloluteibacterium stylophorae]
MTATSASTDGQRRRGRLVEWSGERGTGFIRCEGGDQRLFVHIRAFPRGARPQVGDALDFAIAMGEHGPHAVAVRFATPAACGARPRPAPGGRRHSRPRRRYVAAVVALLLALLGFALWRCLQPPPAAASPEAASALQPQRAPTFAAPGFRRRQDALRPHALLRGSAAPSRARPGWPARRSRRRHSLRDAAPRSSRRTMRRG